MKNNPALWRQLIGTFLEELDEHIDILNRGVMWMEGGELIDHEGLHRLFRSAHSLKGASAAFGLTPIEHVCHWLEDRLEAARDGLMPEPHEFAELFAAIDAVQAAGRRLAAGEELGDKPLLPWLRGISIGQGPRAFEMTEGGLVASAEPDDGFDPDAPLPDPSQEGASDEAQEQAPATADEDGRQTPAAMPLLIPQPWTPPGMNVPSPRTATPTPVHVGGPVETHDDGGAARAARAATAPRLPPPETVPGTESLFLRVPVNRLDALYAGSGELVRTRLRMQECSQTLRDICEKVAFWQVAWHGVEAWTARARKGGAAPSVSVLRTIEDGATQLRELRGILEALTTRVQADDILTQSVVGRLQTLIAGVRLQPFGEICHGLERAVRDVARAGNKDVQLTILGSNVELDRSILAALRDPLVHLVRNAVDHGIETPQERARVGKLPTGRVVVEARLRGSTVEVQVSDDGRGIDLAAIRTRAASKGWPVPVDDVATAALIFKPAFSTASRVTEYSGRGVGLDVVKHDIEALNGTVDVISNTNGVGSRFVLVTPLTLSNLRALMVRHANQIYAVPSATVERAMRLKVRDIKFLGGRPLLISDGRAIPIANFGTVLTRTPATTLDEDAPALLLGLPPRQAIFVVEELLTELEITIQALSPRVGTSQFFSGATVLADGRIILVVNGGALVGTVVEEEAPTRMKIGTTETVRKRLLVVDDSLTVRALEKSLLEAAGYEVTVAVDGLDGWEKLQENPVDLVVSDVEMPRATGLELVRMVRESPAHKDLPLILVTSLSSEEHRAAGLRAGANAYVVKSVFDQHQLLDIIEQLL